MDLVKLVLEIFFISFLLNMLWEFVHSQLYETCLRMKLKECIPLLVGASIKDGLWISFFYLITVLIFINENILGDVYQLVFFIVLALLFSFFDEKVSLNMKRWQYSKNMPTILGVGWSPLLELAATGTLTFLYIFLT